MFFYTFFIFRLVEGTRSPVTSTFTITVFTQNLLSLLSPFIEIMSLFCIEDFLLFLCLLICLSEFYNYFLSVFLSVSVPFYNKLAPMDRMSLFFFQELKAVNFCIVSNCLIVVADGE